MNTTLLISCSVIFSLSGQVCAQDVPTDVVGDTGWIVLDGDTLVLVRAADDNVWSQQNMGATRVAIAFNDTASFGDLYQWGRWDDGHQSRTSATAQAAILSPNNPAGLGVGSGLFYIGPDLGDWWSAGSGTDTWQAPPASATNGIDVCTYLGEGWRMPTQTDWMEVLAAEGITNFTTAFTSNLKLPAAGSRHSTTGTLINEGLFGNYWCSTPSTIYAKDVTIADSFVNPNDDAYRGYGMSVRCLNRTLHVAVEEHSGDRVPHIFPNPSSGTFTVDHGAVIINSILVYASDMRLVGTWNPGTLSTMLSLDRFPTGLYWIKVVCADAPAWRTIVVAR